MYSPTGYYGNGAAAPQTAVYGGYGIQNHHSASGHHTAADHATSHHNAHHAYNASGSAHHNSNGALAAGFTAPSAGAQASFNGTFAPQAYPSAHQSQLGHHAMASSPAYMGVPQHNSTHHTMASASAYTSMPQYSTQLPLAGRHRVTTTLWEDEGTLCFQVDAKGVCVARRHDNNMINGTKLLNVCGMSRGKRDGILKNEKERIVVKVGAMHLKGVWISFARGKQLAEQNGIAEILYPLFENNIQSFLYHPDNYPRTAAVMAAAQERHAQRQRLPGSNSPGMSMQGGASGISQNSNSSLPPPLMRSQGSIQHDSNGTAGSGAWAQASATSQQQQQQHQHQQQQQQQPQPQTQQQQQQQQHQHQHQQHQSQHHHQHQHQQPHHQAHQQHQQHQQHAGQMQPPALPHDASANGNGPGPNGALAGYPGRPAPVDRRHSMPLGNMQNHPGHAENPYGPPQPSSGGMPPGPRRTPSGTKRSYDEHESADTSHGSNGYGAPGMSASTSTSSFSSAHLGGEGSDSPRMYKRMRDVNGSGHEEAGALAEYAPLSLSGPLRSPGGPQSWTPSNNSTPSLTASSATLSSMSNGSIMGGSAAYSSDHASDPTRGAGPIYPTTSGLDAYSLSTTGAGHKSSVYHAAHQHGGARFELH